ncbi:MAG: SDR family oxidoreductase [Nocardiopsaceae bacterium]|nr:SDR family oxidoreductase [Nocardiopsaceae bacterium]
MADRRALVTGGVSGIGLATAQRLRAEGASVIVIDRRPRGTQGSSGEGDEPIPCVQADVSNPRQVADAFTDAADLLGGPADVLVNAAGIYQIRPARELSPENWDETMAINLRGPFLTCQAFANVLIDAQQPGSIVNIASTAALIADPAEPAAHYNASKAGVLSLTRQLAVELAPHDIRVNAVCPGVIDTPMLRLMDDPVAGKAYLETGVPLRRLGTPAEVAATIVFLASQDASYITGSAVVVDGGTTAI